MTQAPQSPGEMTEEAVPEMYTNSGHSTPDKMLKTEAHSGNCDNDEGATPTPNKPEGYVDLWEVLGRPIREYFSRSGHLITPKHSHEIAAEIVPSLAKFLSTRDAARDAELAEAKAQARTPDQEMLDFANDVMGAYPPGSPEYRLAEFVWVTRPTRSPSPSPGQNT